MDLVSLCLIDGLYSVSRNGDARHDDSSSDPVDIGVFALSRWMLDDRELALVLAAVPQSAASVAPKRSMALAESCGALALAHT